MPHGSQWLFSVSDNSFFLFFSFLFHARTHTHTHTTAVHLPGGLKPLSSSAIGWCRTAVMEIPGLTVASGDVMPTERVAVSKQAASNTWAGSVSTGPGDSGTGRTKGSDIEYIQHKNSQIQSHLQHIFVMLTAKST